MIWREWLAERAARRESEGLRRRLRPRAADDDVARICTAIEAAAVVG